MDPIKYPHEQQPSTDLEEQSLHKPSATKRLRKHTLLYSHAFVSSSTPASSPLSFPRCPHSPWVILSSPLSFFLTFSPYIFISLILPLVSPSSGILKPSLLSLLYIFLLSVLFTFPLTKSFCLLGRHIHSELSGLFLIWQLAYILC